MRSVVVVDAQVYPLLAVSSYALLAYDNKIVVLTGQYSSHLTVPLAEKVREGH